MKNVYLFQPHYAQVVNGKTNYWLPYSVGCIWSYAQQFDFVKKNFHLDQLFFKRQDPETVLNQIQNPVICGFSCYIWNEKYCLFIAEQIKKKWPNCLIVFGGPSVNSESLKYEFIDSVVISEGEEHFLDILDRINKNLPVQKIYDKKRLVSLDIPSPYISGVFNNIIADHPDAVWAVTFETNRGCPYACTFCNWGGVIESKVKKFGLERIKQELDWMKSNPIVFMFGGDANFGIFGDRDIEISKMLRDTVDNSMLEFVELQYAKNSSKTMFEIAKILGDVCRGVTVSLQSTNEATLQATKRKNLEINKIQPLMKLAEEYGVKTYTDLIIGLPEETLDSWKNTMTDVMEMGQHDKIDLFWAEILKNTELSDINTISKYNIKTTKVKEIISSYHEDNWREITEDTYLISSTNTMSTDELIEAYMYSWMTINFHCNGYTQAYARYARNVNGISYRSFYDKLFEVINRNDCFFHNHYLEIKKVVHDYITHGESFSDITEYNEKGHVAYKLSFNYFYQYRDKIFEIGNHLLEYFDINNDSLVVYQNSLMYANDHNYPFDINLDFDILNWNMTPTTYCVISGVNNDDFFINVELPKRGPVKNKFIQKS